MPLMMICPRDYTLQSLSGHVISFQAGVPTIVPDELVSDALAMNIVPDDTQSNSPFSLIKTGITGTLREAILFGAIQEIVSKNNMDDFDGGGHPKAKALADLCGMTLSNTERSKYWNRYREIIGTNSEFPSHPNTGMVLELQQLVTRKQLEEFASANEIDFTRLKAKPVKDIKAELLSLVINQRPNIGVPALQPKSSLEIAD